MNLSHILHLAVFGIILILLARRLPWFAIHRPVAYSMVIGLIVLTGTISLINLPVELMPDIAYGNVTIFIDVRGGMPPQDVERMVTKPVEEAMSTISKMKGITSTSKKHRSVVTIEFEPGTNMSLATMEVREKFMRVKYKLPKEIERPVIAHYEESDAPVVIAALTSDINTPEELRKIVEENLKDKLMRIEGVANVEIGGGRERKILVELDKSKLAAFNIPIKRIVSVLEQNNLNIQVGELKGHSVNYGLRTLGAFRTVSEIENIGIFASQKGSLVRLKDIASVRDYYLEPESYSRLNSKSAVTLYVQKESLTNTVKVARDVKALLEEFKSTLGKDTKMIIVSDQSSAILGAISSVQMTMVYGATLVILILSLFLSKTSFTKWIVAGFLLMLVINLILFYFLKMPLDSSRWLILGILLFITLIALFWRKDLYPSFIVALSIPVSLFIAFTFMYFENFTLNVISLSGLVLGIGLLVDNSIVVLENFDRIRRKMPGLPRAEQVERAAMDMVNPMVGGTLTTIVVFLPFFLLQKQTQMLYSGIAFTVMVSLLASLFSALTIVPALAMRLKEYRDLKEVELKAFPKLHSFQNTIKLLLQDIDYLSGQLIDRVVRIPLKYILYGCGVFCLAFAPIFHFAIKIPWDLSLYVALIGAVLIFGGFMFKYYSAFLYWFVRNGKRAVTGVLILFVLAAVIFAYRLPKDFMASSEQNEFVIFVELASGVKLDISDRIVKEVEKRVQETPEIKDMVKNISSRVEGWSSKVYVTLVPRSERKLSTQEVIDRLRNRFKGIGEQYDTFVYFSEPRSGKEIFIEVYGYSYETLSKLAMQIASEIGKVPQFSDVKVRYRPGQPEATVDLDQARVAMFGLDNKEVAETMHAQMRGLRATSFYNRAEEVETIVRLQPDQCKTIEQIKGLLFITPQGLQIPAEHISSLVFGLSPSEIWHRNKSRMIQVSASLGSMPLGKAAEISKQLVRKIPFPEEYYADIGGDYEDMVQANRDFKIAMAVTVLLIFAVMACLFESLSQPFIIMITVLLSIIGAVSALIVSGSTVTLGVSIGMIMLGGIVVNNGIMLVDRINILKQRHKDVSIHGVIIWAASQRKRPIFMTTTTTVLGLLPMALDTSESSVLWSPLAITVIGGLVTSTILTLFVVPCFYSLFNSIRKTYIASIVGFFKANRRLKNGLNQYASEK